MTEANVTAVLGISQVNALTAERWDAALSAAAAVGLAAVELPVDTTAEKVQQARDREVSVVVLRWTDDVDGARLASADAAQREQALDRVTADLAAAAEVGASVVTVLPAASRLTPGSARLPEYADTLAATHDALRSLVGPAARHGVAVGVEMAAEGFLLSPVEARELLDLVGTPDIGACLDLPTIARTARPADWIRTLRHRIVCLRLDGGSDVDLAEVAAALGEVRYRGPVVIAGESARVVGLAYALGRRLAGHFSGS